jgi:hypothetical protein
MYEEDKRCFMLHTKKDFYLSENAQSKRHTYDFPLKEFKNPPFPFPKISFMAVICHFEI